MDLQNDPKKKVKWVAVPPGAKFKEQDKQQDIPWRKILCYRRTDSQEIKAWVTKGTCLLIILSWFAISEAPQWPCDTSGYELTLVTSPGGKGCSHLLDTADEATYPWPQFYSYDYISWPSASISFTLGHTSSPKWICAQNTARNYIINKPRVIPAGSHCHRI